MTSVIPFRFVSGDHRRDELSGTSAFNASQMEWVAKGEYSVWICKSLFRLDF